MRQLTIAAIVLICTTTSGALGQALYDPQPTYPVVHQIFPASPTLEKITSYPSDYVVPLDRPHANELNLQNVKGWAPGHSTVDKPGKMVLGYEPGGVIHLHFQRFLNMRATGADVEITKECNSACTVITNIFPKDKLCFGPNASLGFHKAHYADGRVSMEDTQRMFELYPQDIRDWINAKGGIEKLPFGLLARPMYWTLTAPELWKMGYRKCD